MRAKNFFFRPNPIQPGFNSFSTKMMGELTLLRHAESDHNVQSCCAGYYNRSKPTIEGLEKTRNVGKLLAKSDVKFDTLYVSPLDRAFITAATLLKELPPIKITTNQALAERNFGGFTGMSKTKIKEILNPEEFNRYLNDRNFFPPDIAPGHKYFQSKELYGAWPENHKGESYQCVINRLIPFLKKIKEDLLNGKNILIVGHSHNLQILQMLFYGKEFEQGIERYKIEHVTPIKFTFSLNSEDKLIVEEKVNLTEVGILDEFSWPHDKYSTSLVSPCV
ncbi:MAG: phosphoglycerate mutase family protein [Legionellaceae bacterium]|nr:phosphoglycerate mutase family protein [Legionellaceae bacterium]